MKLLTLNTHSLIEEDYFNKLNDFVQAVSKEKFDLIALQEVNQTFSKEIVSDLDRFTPCVENSVIRADNHIYNVVKMLEEMGINYYFSYLPIKRGYGILDEGLGIMSLSPIIETDVLLVSSKDDYNDWKTRKLLGVKTKDYSDTWFYSVHFGFWGDEDEPFFSQWQKTNDYMKHHNKVFLLGDFNSPAEIRNEGYDKVLEDGWYDTYNLAKIKDKGITVGKVIDGWKDKTESTDGMRIDQIWCNKKVSVEKSEVVFDGENYPTVSDHYGVTLTLKGTDNE